MTDAEDDRCPRRRRAGRFIAEEVAMGPSLVIPLRMLYRRYKSWCDENGLPDPRPSDLRTYLKGKPWAKILEPKGRGRLRTVVEGLGLQKAAPKNP